MARFFTSCHPPGVKRGFIKGEATRLVRTNSSQTIFEECFSNFKLRHKMCGYPNNFIERSLKGVQFVEGWPSNKEKRLKRTFCHMPYATTNHPAVRGPKEISFNE